MSRSTTTQSPASNGTADPTRASPNCSRPRQLAPNIPAQSVQQASSRARSPLCKCCSTPTTRTLNIRTGPAWPLVNRSYPLSPEELTQKIERLRAQMSAPIGTPFTSPQSTAS